MFRIERDLIAHRMLVLVDTADVQPLLWLPLCPDSVVDAGRKTDCAVGHFKPLIAPPTSRHENMYLPTHIYIIRQNITEKIYMCASDADL